MKTTRRSSVRNTSAASNGRLKPESEPAMKKFIKIILQSTIKEKMMKIPARFVRCGPKFSDNVTIETPVGFKRSIRIKRIGNEVWFENGWSEFAEAHSISKGHFLFFHYKENSSFLVTIFDVSAMEIDYPLDKVNVIKSDDDDDDEEKGFSGFENSDNNDSSEGVIDLDELLKMNPRDNIKSEKITLIDDDVEG
ncbi:hypothetical protein AALP_AA4G065900 [Arabis alpina]|uniref:TF-B3 domain-containing protein n=1 Tax=Arabis alpina TaxID=50452 RepID=A0A087H1K7_ARAAL|nr:hypothetical protein AALP_AA4G065900 [Arabis alpina]